VDNTPNKAVTRRINFLEVYIVDKKNVLFTTGPQKPYRAINIIHTINRIYYKEYKYENKYY